MKRTLCLIWLVCAALSPSVSAAAGEAVPLRGTFRAVETNEFNFPIVTVTGAGVGTASHLGRFTLTVAVSVNLTTASGPASAELIAANGDRLSAEGFGQARDEGNVIVIVETYTITGGTGRFADIGGEFTVERRLNPATLESIGTLSGMLVK